MIEITVKKTEKNGGQNRVVINPRYLIMADYDEIENSLMLWLAGGINALNPMVIDENVVEKAEVAKLYHEIKMRLITLNK